MDQVNPYAPPASEASTHYASRDNLANFVSLATRTQFVTLAIVTFIVGGLLRIAAAFAIPAADDAQTGLTCLSVIAFGFSGLSVCFWIHRAAKNIRALGRVTARYSPGYCVAYFFIPILNLFRPYQAMKEIWLASDPEETRRTWPQGTVGGNLPLWWGSWLVAQFLLRMTRAMRTLDETDAFNLIGTVGFAASAVAGIALILIVREICKRQNELARQKVRRLRTSSSA